MHKIIEALILLLLVLALTTGFGYLLGGELPSFKGSAITNGLTLLIAISNIVSAIVTGITLFFLITFRHDWLKPKGTDVTLDLRLAMKSWFDTREGLNRCVYDGLYSGFELSIYGESKALSEHYYYLKSIVKNEEDLWLNLTLLIEKYSFYYPNENIELIKKFKDIRSDLYKNTLSFFANLEGLQSIHELRNIKRIKGDKYNALKPTVDILLSKLIVNN